MKRKKIEIDKVYFIRIGIAEDILAFGEENAPRWALPGRVIAKAGKKFLVEFPDEDSSVYAEVFRESFICVVSPKSDDSK